jgi:predicted DNA repair protein MutK
MARDIGQRLLQDVEHLAFLFRFEAQVGQAVVVMQDDPGAFLEAAGQALQGVFEAHRVHAAAELHQQLAQVAVGVVQRLADVAGILGALLERLVGDGVVEHGHAHLHVGQGLRQRIVDFGGHHLPLAGQHDAQVFALEARVLQRHAEVLADRAEQQRDFLGQFEGLRQEQVVGAEQAPRWTAAPPPWPGSRF